MEILMQDLRYARRQFGRNPGFAAAAVLTLALGIGANTAIFSVVDTVLLRSPPYAEPDRLVLLWHRSEATGSSRLRISAPDVAAFRERSSAFSGFAFVGPARDALLGAASGTAGRGNAHVRLGQVSPNFFSLLGVRAAMGRTFRPGESVLPPAALTDSAPPPPPGVVILSHGLWRHRFGADPGVVGRTVRIDGSRMRVVGVLPSAFELLLPAETGIPPVVEAWTPLRIPLARMRRAEGLLDQDSDNTGAVVGRLRPGVSLARAGQEMSRISAGQREELPFYGRAEMRIDVAPLQEDAVAAVRPALLALVVGVGVVLLIACMNVSNLFLARAADRERELQVRHALGAGRARLARQLLTEAGLLGALGAAAGLVLAFYALELLPAVAPAELPRLRDVDIDLRSLGFTLGLTLAVTLVAGGVPALLCTRRAGRSSLRTRSADPGPPSFDLRRALVVSQVALCLTLLVGAGLLLRSFSELRRVDLGFRPGGLVTFRATLPPGIVGGPAARAELMDRLLDRIRAVPEVGNTGLVGGLPLGGAVWTQPYRLDGQPFDPSAGRPPAGRPPDAGSGEEANFRVITSDYFRAMGTRLLSGRFFNPVEDVVEGERVVIVDGTVARRIAPGGSVVGRRLSFPLDGDPVTAEIVGVVEPIRHADPRRSARATLYVPYRQEASRSVAVVVRADRGGGGALLSAVRRAASEFAAAESFPVYDFRPMSAYVARALAENRIALTAFTALGLLAMLLATVGLYGVMSGGVARRAREIGVRMALGASESDVARHFLAGGLRLVAAGLVIGGGLSLVLSRSLSGLLFGVSRTDPVAHLVVGVLLLVVATGAVWLPARRAAAMEPAETLRSE